MPITVVSSTPVSNVSRTTCPYCGVGCGISASGTGTGTGIDTGSITVQGDKEHPANFGRLCSKGSTLAHTLRSDGRLLHPQIHGIRASWPQAIDFVAQQFLRTIEQHGPDAVAFYVSGQLLTEDYYVANKLMKGFIGSGNIDTNSRLCMSSAVAGHKRAFGEDSVPGCYEDLEIADLIVLTGSNTAWCHPVLFQRIKTAKQNNPAMKVVVIDPRETATCEIADLHLELKPGSDVKLFNGLLQYLAQQDCLDQDYIAAHTEGFADAIASAHNDAPSIDAVASACDIPADKIRTLYDWFARTGKTVTAFSQGVNQSSSGTDKVNAIINCHLATGRIGKPGASPFSLTGQPNAMGGREVGGLANQLAAHMDFYPEQVDRVRRFWNAPRMASGPGLKAVELFDAVEAGTIKAIWIMGTNPVVSLPNADQAIRALQACPLVVVSDCIAKTDTTAFAHVLLPASGWGEKDGTVTNSERRISRQRPLLATLGEARPDWRILTDVAHAMGFSNHFQYENPVDVFREHAALSAFENGGSSRRAFNIAGLQTLDNADYDALQPVQWPVLDSTANSGATSNTSSGTLTGTTRLYTDGRFSTPTGKARFIALQTRAVANAVSAEFPLALNTGRVRDQWHTMTRTALAPQLNAHKPEPFAEIHPDTDARFNISDGGYVRVRSPWGSMQARAVVTPGVRAGDVFVPMHWNEQFARNARVGALVNPATDPHSGQPESKHTPCTIEAWQPDWIGFLFSRVDLPLPDCAWAVKVRGEQFFRYELAGNGSVGDWTTLAHRLGLALPQGETPSLLYEDPRQGSFRWASFDGDQLQSCAFAGPAHSPAMLGADRRWLASLFAKPGLDALDRKALLSGKSPAGVEDCGRTVCACFGVGEKTILKAIREHRLTSAADVGKHLKAGTNCGSCVAEIKTLLAGS